MGLAPNTNDGVIVVVTVAPKVNTDATFENFDSSSTKMGYWY